MSSKDIDNIKSMKECLDRVAKEMPEIGMDYIYNTIGTSLHFAHESLVRKGHKGIDFATLAVADSGDFCHDIGGIDRHVSRKYPYDLEGGFLPRIRLHDEVNNDE